MKIISLYTLQVTENPNINSDPRNQAISAAADGVPFFKDRNAANGWPVVLYPESAPVGIAAQKEEAHMVGMVPSEYLDEDEKGTRVIVKKYTCTHTPRVSFVKRFGVRKSTLLS
jgi:hypothetical protein